MAEMAELAEMQHTIKLKHRISESKQSEKAIIIIITIIIIATVQTYQLRCLQWRSRDYGLPIA
jgi:hypothetical protein